MIEMHWLTGGGEKSKAEKKLMMKEQHCGMMLEIVLFVKVVINMVVELLLLKFLAFLYP